MISIVLVVHIPELQTSEEHWSKQVNGGSDKLESVPKVTHLVDGVDRIRLTVVDAF